jgi:hypothetical protein
MAGFGSSISSCSRERTVKRDVLLGLAFILIAPAVAKVLSGNLAALVSCFLGIVVVIVLVLRSDRAVSAGRFVPTLKEMCEGREAQARMEREELDREAARINHQRIANELATAKATQEMYKYYRAIKNHTEGVRAMEGGGVRIPLEPIAAPGEDPELVREAWLRYKAEIEETFNREYTSARF